MNLKQAKAVYFSSVTCNPGSLRSKQNSSGLCLNPTIPRIFFPTPESSKTKRVISIVRTYLLAPSFATFTVRSLCGFWGKPFYNKCPGTKSNILKPSTVELKNVLFHIYGLKSVQITFLAFSWVCTNVLFPKAELYFLHMPPNNFVLLFRKPTLQSPPNH
jgi:hypothetical protein